jgi:hypothetical protein
MRVSIWLHEDTIARLSVEAVRQRRDLRDQAAIIIEQALAQADLTKQAPGTGYPDAGENATPQ